MIERPVTVKTVTLSNNCPECYNNTGLELTFKQQFKENSFYKSLSKDYTVDLNCKTCNEAIYPVRWTEDIERVIDYQKRAFVPKPSKTALKQTSWMLIVGSALLVALVVLFIFEVV